MITTFVNVNFLFKPVQKTFSWKYVFCSATDILWMGGSSAFVGVDVPETLKLPLPSGSWSQSHCFLQCGHPTGGEVQTMAFHCRWMQIDIVCWEQGLNLFVVGVMLLDKWTMRWRRPYSRCGASLLKNEYFYYFLFIQASPLLSAREILEILRPVFLRGVSLKL